MHTSEGNQQKQAEQHNNSSHGKWFIEICEPRFANYSAPAFTIAKTVDIISQECLVSSVQSHTPSQHHMDAFCRNKEQTPEATT